MSRKALYALLAAPLFTLGCGDVITTTTATTFTELKPTITTSCAIPSCHGPMSDLGGGKRLDLATNPYTALVGAATQAPLFAKLKADLPTLIVAGDPAKSACYVKMTLATANDTNYGARMPQSNAPLDAATLAKFKSWIEAGAQNN